MIKLKFLNPIRFRDRSNAGRKLADKLINYKIDNPVILALPRGGVPVAFQIVKKLELRHDILIVRKIGLPGNPEFGVGAISENSLMYLDENTFNKLKLTRSILNDIIKKEESEIKRQLILYRGDRKIIDLYNQTVIIVDDGLATGVTALCAVKTVMKFYPKKIIYATPVCAGNSASALKKEIEAVVCVSNPFNLQSIGEFYDHFDQVSDNEVLAFLNYKL